MSAKSSRKKKTPPPRKGARPAKGTGASVVGEPAAEAGGALPAPGDVPPLTAFRAPSVIPPKTALPPRTATARPTGPTVGNGSAAGGGRTAPRPAGRSAAGGVRLGSSVPAVPDRPSSAPDSSSGRAAAGGRTAVATPPAQPAVSGRAPFLAGDMPAGPVQVMSWNCSQLDGMEPQGLGLTYWFDAAPTGDPYPVDVRFTGRRVVEDGQRGPRDSFETVRTIQRVLPGSGRISVTTRVPDVAPGTWEVTATPVVPKPAGGSPPRPRPTASMPRGSSEGTTAFLPVVNVRAPGVRIGAWPALVGLGFLAAMVLQWVLAAQRDLPAGRMLLVSVVGALIGLVGAKVYYVATHRGENTNALTAGMSVQGFVIAAISTIVLGSWAVGIPVGAMLDVIAPGLLLGMTIGRLGCFFGGCCVGLPTASRWGIWSSDRGVGVRRIPVQLFESAMAGTVATATLLAVLLLDPPVDGLLFVAGFSAYTFGRQVLFPLRGIPRKTSHGRLVTMVVTGLALVGSVATLLLG